jgi:hypothetical protein
MPLDDFPFEKMGWPSIVCIHCPALMQIPLSQVEQSLFGFMRQKLYANKVEPLAFLPNLLEG